MSSTVNSTILAVDLGKFNSVLGFSGRLAAAGKPKTQAAGACMRKLAMPCYGALKNRAPFDPAWASRRAA